MSYFDSFTGLYKLSKTLRFELKPVGKTADFLKERNGLAGDFKRAEDYPKVKEFLDGQHKALIERALTGVEFNWNPLAEALDAFRKDATFKEALSSEQSRYREDIAHVLKGDKAFDTLNGATPKDFFKGYLSNGDTTDSPVATFAKFSCYFTGFQENRKNVYSSEEIVTAVPYRVINDNFPKYYSNVKVFEILQAKYPEIIEAVENNLKDYLGGRKLSSIFTLNNYSSCLTQSGISFINTIIGGYSVKDAPKIRGINEEVNQYLQKHPELSRENRPPRMTLLFKQILSDRETQSFVMTQFQNDTEATAAIDAFAELLKEEKVLSSVVELLSTISSTTQNIYIAGSELSKISMRLSGYWGLIRDAQESCIETILAMTKVTKAKEKELREALEANVFALTDLLALDLTLVDEEDNEKKYSLLDYWSHENCDSVIQKVKDTETAYNTLKARVTTSNWLHESHDNVEIVKAYLDALQELLHYLKPLRVSNEINKDQGFYAEFDSIYDTLELIIPLYNRVRNYLTRKIGDIQKIRLYFDLTTRTEGWKDTKIKERKTVLFERDGAYYLGFIPSKSRVPAFNEFVPEEDKATYRLMIYKQMGNASNYLSIKQIKPTLLCQMSAASSNEKKEYYTNILKWLGGVYDAKKKKWVNGKFDKHALSAAELAQLISYVINEFIPSYDNLRGYKFRFNAPESYPNWKSFTDHVQMMGCYSINFEEVSKCKIDDLVERGELYLFQLWNKDFSENSTGFPNLHTLYWRSLFAPENLQQAIVQLNGGAELFYRLAPLQKPQTIHEKGTKLVNRHTRDGKLIPEVYYQEIYQEANGMLEKGKTLSEDARKWKSQAVIKDAKHTIIKNRRYTEDKYFFHVPITFNFTIANKSESLNTLIRDAIRNNPDVNIIGLDRGERNLLYLTLINQKGEILKQKSFNIVEHVGSHGETLKTNYHDKLKDRERNRDRARKSWDTIGKIKDLKEGYLSAVIHEIVTLMLEYNAIIVLEDLNFGFKRGRFCVERQVYQKFEKMLIDKLNYLSLKTRAITVLGGVLKGYQLTEKFESFQKLGKQSGILFYVPAAYTSKIDPTTGFTNLFNLKKCTNVANRKAFFEQFDEIRYDEKRKAFAFTFDYDKFKTSQTSYQKKWTIYSAETRLTYQRGKDGNGRKTIVHPTTLITDAIKLLGFEVKDGLNLLDIIKQTPADAKHAKLYGDLFYAFERTLQMRNSSSMTGMTGEDYIESPVESTDGIRFDTREVAKKGKDATLPVDADANGAYHIALKGLWMLKHLPEKGKTPLPKLEHAQWLKFMQTKEWLK